MVWNPLFLVKQIFSGPNDCFNRLLKSNTSMHVNLVLWYLRWSSWLYRPTLIFFPLKGSLVISPELKFTGWFLFEDLLERSSYQLIVCFRCACFQTDFLLNNTNQMTYSEFGTFCSPGVAVNQTGNLNTSTMIFYGPCRKTGLVIHLTEDLFEGSLFDVFSLENM